MLVLLLKLYRRYFPAMRRWFRQGLVRIHQLNHRSFSINWENQSRSETTENLSDRNPKKNTMPSLCSSICPRQRSFQRRLSLTEKPSGHRSHALWTARLARAPNPNTSSSKVGKLHLTSLKVLSFPNLALKGTFFIHWPQLETLRILGSVKKVREMGKDKIWEVYFY